MARGHVWQGDVRGRRDGHCSGRYASYWNAFLLFQFSIIRSRLNSIFLILASETVLRQNKIPVTKCYPNEY